jgi:hypothetical protein
VIGDLPQLRDQIVFLEVTDARHVGMNAQAYRMIARSVRETIERELGGLTMSAFAIAALPTLQTTAENIYFDSHGCFADLDGSGHARTAQALAKRLLSRASAR